jgi:hypothetical protein
MVGSGGGERCWSAVAGRKAARHPHTPAPRRPPGRLLRLQACAAHKAPPSHRIRDDPASQGPPTQPPVDGAPTGGAHARGALTDAADSVTVQFNAVVPLLPSATLVSPKSRYGRSACADSSAHSSATAAARSHSRRLAADGAMGCLQERARARAGPSRGRGSRGTSATHPPCWPDRRRPPPGLRGPPRPDVSAGRFSAMISRKQRCPPFRITSGRGHGSAGTLREREVCFGWLWSPVHLSPWPRSPSRPCRPKPCRPK